MALVTTIGGASADSYGTLAEYQAYGASMGWTMGADDAADEVNLRRGALALDRGYSFKGYPAASTQALEWPRLDVGYVNGYDVASTVIPQDIKNAQFEVAFLIQGGLDPFKTVDGAVTKAKAGPVEVEYSGGGSAEPRIVAIEGLLAPYLAFGSGQVRVARG